MARASHPPTTPLGAMLRLYLASERLTMREVGRAIGCSAATICRIVDGQGMDARTLLRLLTWLLDEEAGGR